MQLSSTRRNLGKVAAILGILQGFAWAAMALAAIILHNWSPNLKPETNYTQLLQYWLYTHFLAENNNSPEGMHFIIRPSDFTIIMWIYFLLSVGWFSLSIDQLTAIHYEKQRQTVLMIIWGIVTLIVSLIDLIFVSLLARDYASCYGYSTVINTEETSLVINETSYSCYLTVGIVMTIAARGYTLWLLNIVLSILMFYVSANITRENSKVDNLYANHRIPRVTIPKVNNDSTWSRSLSRDGKISPDFLSQTQDDGPRPSFLSRGDKFSY